GEIAVGIDREEAGRRVVEIIDGMLELLEHVLLPLELARDVGERPYRHARLALALAERPYPHPQPAPGFASVGADPHFLLQAAPLAGGPQQAIDRLRDSRIADEHTLDGPHIAGDGGADELQIGRIGIDHAATGV